MPACRPFVRHITTKGARWLFGKGLDFECDKENLTEEINEIWEYNRMNQKMVAAARLAGQSGSIALKFSYDEENKGKEVNIQILDGTEYVRWYYNPHDVDELLMARIQYPYQGDDGKFYWHREDWYPDKLVKYKPRPTSHSNMHDTLEGVTDVDEGEGWEPLPDEPNEFGVIPVTQVRNIETGGTFGAGDLWGLWQSIDQINFAYDLAHKHNQLAVWPKRVYIDLMAEGDEAVIDGPGASESLLSEGDKPGQFLQVEVKGDVREHLDNFAKELLYMVYDSSGSVMLRTEDITNKGNLTQSVLTQLYAPLIETTGEKRDSYGENGVCKFLETMSIGLNNLKKGFGEVDVQAKWPEFFDLTEDELKILTERKTSMVGSGLITRERAVKEIARAEGMKDLDEIVKELPPEPAPESGGDNTNEQTNKPRGKERPKAG